MVGCNMTLRLVPDNSYMECISTDIQDLFDNNECHLRFNFLEYVEKTLGKKLKGYDLIKSVYLLIDILEKNLQREHPLLTFHISNEKVPNKPIDFIDVYLDLQRLPSCYQNIAFTDETGTYFLDTIEEVESFLEEEITDYSKNLLETFVNKNSPELVHWLLK